MSGAGISVSAGIPDFRSPGSGLYEKIKKEYDLETPELIFTIWYFEEHPEPFYKFSTEFDVSKYNPTPTHYFLKLLQDKDLLHICFTQNIDGLELKAGVNEDKLVQAHGSFQSSHCIGCKKEFSQEIMFEHIREQNILRCDYCNSLVKPDVVLFGEKLPQKFQDNISKCRECDLLLVIGTSLKVFPFAGLKDLVPSTVPKVLINQQKLSGFDGHNQLSIIDSCDQVIAKLCKDIEWEEDFRKLISK